jgi:hypothetical protein
MTADRFIGLVVYNGVKTRFVVVDVFHLSDLKGSFEFFFDRGCYHAVRRNAPVQYAPTVARIWRRAAAVSFWPAKCEPQDPGLPVATEEEIRDELGAAFQILDLQECRFDEAPGVTERFLGWSCLVEER